MQNNFERLVGQHDYLMGLEIRAEFLHVLHFLVSYFCINHCFADVVDRSLLFL